MKEATIIVPAYNEETGLPVVLDKVRELGRDYEIIVVDDGSSDGTARITNHDGVIVIRHWHNQGKGSALLTGFSHASSDIVVWIDADDTYPVEKIPDMVSAIHNGYDIVTCPRLKGRHNIPKFNRVGNWLFTTMIRTMYSFPGHDVCTGLIAIKREYLLRMSLLSRGFAIEPEVCLKSGRLGLRLLEIPIEYAVRRGSSNLNGIKAGWEDLTTILKMSFWRLRNE